MFIPKERTRPSVNGNAAFIKKMVELNLSFSCGYASPYINSYVGRVEYCGRWINYIHLESFSAGILPFLIENLTGDFILSENAYKLFNKLRGQLSVLFFDRDWLYSTIPSFTRRRAYKGSGEEESLLDLVYNYDRVKTPKITLTRYIFGPTNFEGVGTILGERIYYKPHRLDRDEANSNLSTLLKRCSANKDFPTYLRGKPEEPFLLANGWMQPIKGEGLYIPTNSWLRGS